MKVLIAEDDVISRSALERNIRDWGYEVHATGNGEDAWDSIQSGDIRLAILDWEMPKMDGIELCRKIRHEVQEIVPAYPQGVKHKCAVRVCHLHPAPVTYSKWL